MTKVGSSDHAATMVLCFAEGRGDSWEALCLDLDLAVQGRSFEEVYQKLNDQISLYLETLADLPAAERDRLLARSVPLWTKICCVAKGFVGLLQRSGSKERHEFTKSLPMAAHGALPA